MVAWDGVGAVASLATAFFTGGLLYVAATQTKALRKENRKWETIQACQRYTIDPTLFACARAIRSASNGRDYSLAAMKPVIQEIRTIVNYFDALAVGVAQGVYVAEIIEDNLSLVINLAVDKFLTDDFAAELNLNAFSNLRKLRDSWREKPATRYYAERH